MHDRVIELQQLLGLRHLTFLEKNALDELSFKCVARLEPSEILSELW